MNLDTAVKLKIYETLAETGEAPTSYQVAAALGRAVAEVEEAFQILCSKRLLVLEPGTTSRIQMAPPFSGVHTSFRVVAGDKSYYANCVWDALGIPAALYRDAQVVATDGLTGEPLQLEVRNGRPIPWPCAIHFAVPAARWWDDIIYT